MVSVSSTDVLAAEGFDGVRNMIDGIAGPLAAIGLSILVIMGLIIGVKMGFSGKGQMRESLQGIMVWLVAGAIIGLASILPALASSVGKQIGSTSTGGGGYSTVDGQ